MREMVQQTSLPAVTVTMVMSARAAEENPLSNNAASVGATSAIGINWSRGLGGGLGLREDGGD